MHVAVLLSHYHLSAACCYCQMSDWWGTHSTVAAALAGLDQEMPDDEFFGPALLEAVQNGTVPESVLDDKVLRILTGMYAAGLFDRPVTGNIANNVTSDEHNALARSFAANAMVLLVNNGILPLSDNQPYNIAVRAGGYGVANSLRCGCRRRDGCGQEWRSSAFRCPLLVCRHLFDRSID